MSKLQIMHVKIPPDMYRAIKRQMKCENKTASAIIREAVAAWLARRGDIVEPSVSWGGYRESEDTDVGQYAGEVVA